MATDEAMIPALHSVLVQPRKTHRGGLWWIPSLVQALGLEVVRKAFHNLGVLLRDLMRPQGASDPAARRIGQAQDQGAVRRLHDLELDLVVLGESPERDVRPLATFCCFARVIRLPLNYELVVLKCLLDRLFDITGESSYKNVRVHHAPLDGSIVFILVCR